MMKQRLEVLVPLGAIAVVIAISKPWSHLQTLQQLWSQRSQRIERENVEVRSPSSPPVQLGRIRGQIVHDTNGNGQSDQQITVVYVENFDAVIPVKSDLGQPQRDASDKKTVTPKVTTRVTPTWSNPQTTVISPASSRADGDRILGLFGGVEDGEQGHTTLIVNNLPPHHSVELAVELWIVDAWDGNLEATFAPDLWQVRQGQIHQGTEQIVLRAAFSNIDSRAHSQSYPLGYPEGQFSPRTNAIATHQFSQGRYGKSIYQIHQTFAHRDSQLTLDFSGQGKTSLTDDESWGLDNLKITVRSGEAGLANVVVFLDQNRNGMRELDEPFTQTDADGNYQFPGLRPGHYRVQVEPSVEPLVKESKEESKEGVGQEMQLNIPFQDIHVLEEQKDHTVNFLGRP